MSGVFHETIRELPTVPLLLRALAGLETGIVGALLLLGWFILDALYQGQHWYAFPNLWATIFYGNDAFSKRAGWATAAGIAVHLTNLGFAGLLFGVIWRWNSRFWTSLVAGLVWSMLWHWGMSVGLWKTFSPLVPRLMPQPATWLAFFLFGVCLSRSPLRAQSIALQAAHRPAEMFPPPLPSQAISEELESSSS